MHDRVRRIALALFMIVALAGPAGAATLCGVVRDASTTQPIPRAGVFLRDTLGAYTGFHAATDGAGRFCIGSLPAGTYDVEVRVDDYVTGYMRRVTVTDGTTSVELTPVRGLALFAPRPNPVRDALTIRFAVAREGFVRVRLVDLMGRGVRTWEGRVSAGEHGFVWNLRDHAGARVAPGRYLIQLESGDARQAKPVTILR